MASTRTLRKIREFSTLDDFLDAEGIRHIFEAIAIEEVRVWMITGVIEKQDFLPGALHGGLDGEDS
jgi:hypothetical protein